MFIESTVQFPQLRETLQPGGIFIDLNGNGKIETNAEYFPDGGIGNIDGKDCWFDIRW